MQNDKAEVQKGLEADPNLLLKLPEAGIEQQSRLKQMLVEAKTKRMTRINESMRSELTSKDKFKSYGFPLFGYFMALTWGAIMLDITYQIFFGSQTSANIINALGQLSSLWGTGLAVLGIVSGKVAMTRKRSLANGLRLGLSFV